MIILITLINLILIFFKLGCTTKTIFEEESEELSTSLISLIKQLPQQIFIEGSNTYWQTLKLKQSFN